jgi:hypothetical protein
VADRSLAEEIAVSALFILLLQFPMPFLKDIECLFAVPEL